jgi:hypothetical protein
MEIDNIREHVFPLFVGDDPARLKSEDAIVLNNSNYLGTGFFIAKNGVALTAGHCVLAPGDIPPGKTLLAIVWRNERPCAQQVTAAFVPAGRDVGILKVSFSPAKYLPVSFEQIHMGEDVTTIGIPAHSVSGVQKEFRCLKGHVTFAPIRLELSFPAPRGMSGSPVFRGKKVVGVLSGNARSETLEDQIEETTEISGGITKIKRVEIKAVVNYGLAEPLHLIGEEKFAICEGLPFSEFIRKINAT